MKWHTSLRPATVLSTDRFTDRNHIYSGMDYILDIYRQFSEPRQESVIMDGFENMTTFSQEPKVRLYTPDNELIEVVVHQDQDSDLVFWERYVEFEHRREVFRLPVTLYKFGYIVGTEHPAGPINKGVSRRSTYMMWEKAMRQRSEGVLVLE